MTDLIYDYITMGVDMIISATILAAVVILLRGTVVLSSYSAQQQATTDKINYYREFTMYDCSDNLLSPDVLSAIVYYRYKLDVVIIKGSNMYYNDRVTGKFYTRPTGGGTSTELDYNELASYIGTQDKYRAYLFEDFKKSGNDYSPSTNGYQGGIINGIKFEYYN